MRSTVPATAFPLRLERRRLGVALLEQDASGRFDDLRLFSITFAAGFLFVSLFIV